MKPLRERLAEEMISIKPLICECRENETCPRYIAVIDKLLSPQTLEMLKGEYCVDEKETKQFILDKFYGGSKNDEWWCNDIAEAIASTEGIIKVKEE